MDWSGGDYCDVFVSCLDSHSDGTHSLQSIHWLLFWRHPFTAEHPLTLILTAPIHCRASIDSYSDGTHSLQSIHWLLFWRHPFTAEHPLVSKSDEEQWPWMTWDVSKFSAHFQFWVNYSFNLECYFSLCVLLCNAFMILSRSTLF